MADIATRGHPDGGRPDGPAAAADLAADGLSDRDIRDRIEDLDRLLDGLERAAGPLAESAIRAVGLLTEVYGTALARVMSAAADAPGLSAILTGDEVLGHLLILHGLHPDPPDLRAARALESLRPSLRDRGGDAELVSVADGVATVRLSGSCQGCAASAAMLQQAVSETLLTAAPELSAVRPVSSRSPSDQPVIPVESLLRKPAGAGPAGGRR